jgi:hypothetical protein
MVTLNQSGEFEGVFGNRTDFVRQEKEVFELLLRMIT